MRIAGLSLGLAALWAVSSEGGFAAEFDYMPKNSPEATVFRGAIVFEKYCQLCHGVTAEGNGRAARIYNPKPANLVRSDKNDQYNELIIRDVIAFVRSIKR